MPLGPSSADSDSRERVERALAFPLPVGAPMRFLGRVKECADLIEPGHRLLDVGCSSGWLGPIAVRNGINEYVGMDRVIVGRGSSTSRIRFVEGSVFNLPFRNASFSGVSLFDVIEHLPRGTEVAALTEARRVLTTTGRLYFSTPHASAVHTPLDPVWCLGHRHYRRATVHRLLEASGFRVDRMFVAGGAIEAIDHIRLLLYKHLLHRPHPPIRLVDHLIGKSHGRDRLLGMTVFAVASPAAR